MQIYFRDKQWPSVSRLLLSLFFLVIAYSASAQKDQAIINSRLDRIVTDSLTKQPIAGVTLRIKGVTHSVSTGSDGRFTFITGQRLPYALIVSFIGYKTKEVIVDGTPVTIK